MSIKLTNFEDSQIVPWLLSASRPREDPLIQGKSENFGKTTRTNVVTAAWRTLADNDRALRYGHWRERVSCRRRDRGGGGGRDVAKRREEKETRLKAVGQVGRWDLRNVKVAEKLEPAGFVFLQRIRRLSMRFSSERLEETALLLSVSTAMITNWRCSSNRMGSTTLSAISQNRFLLIVREGQLPASLASFATLDWYRELSAFLKPLRAPEDCRETVKAVEAKKVPDIILSRKILRKSCLIIWK